MNKQEFVTTLAERQGVSQKEAAGCLDAVFAVLEEALLAGETVKVNNFGVFAVKERAARKGVVPGSNKVIEIPAKKAVTFKPSKTLKEKF